jgi:hypothetical protein
MKLLHSGLFLCNFDPVASDDRGVQSLSRIDLGQSGDEPGRLPIQIVVVPFQRLSSKQSPREALRRRTTHSFVRRPRPTSRNFDAPTQSHETNPTASETKLNIYFAWSWHEPTYTT